VLWRRFSDDSFKFMLAALFLAPEFFHFYGNTDFLRWAIKFGDFLKVFSHLQECCSSAAFWAGFTHVHIHKHDYAHSLACWKLLGCGHRGGI
jgi:hypothetical protein